MPASSITLPSSAKSTTSRKNTRRSTRRSSAKTGYYKSVPKSVQDVGMKVVRIHGTLFLTSTLVGMYSDKVRIGGKIFPAMGGIDARLPVGVGLLAYGLWDTKKVKQLPVDMAYGVLGSYLANAGQNWGNKLAKAQAESQAQASGYGYAHSMGAHSMGFDDALGAVGGQRGERREARIKKRMANLIAKRNKLRARFGLGPDYSDITEPDLIPDNIRLPSGLRQVAAAY